MRFAYENLSADQFENLVIVICSHLFGKSVQPFSKGADGGRDGKFVGTAEEFPSKARPWAGITIIQAKHTNGFNKNFAESDFFSKSKKSTIIGKEVEKIKKLRSKNRLNNYILFANRRLSAIAEEDIHTYISRECDIPYGSIALCGIEQLEHFISLYPEIITEADLDPIDSPLIVSSDDLSEVVQALDKQLSELKNTPSTPPTIRTKYSDKNVINNMTSAYAVELLKRYLKDTKQIQQFLAAPENLELQKKYESATEEFQLTIISKRKDYQTFDEVMIYLSKLLIDRDPVLRQNKRLTRSMLFYMYWNCDIGANNVEA